MRKILKKMKNEEARINTQLGFVGWFLGIDAFLLGILLANYNDFGSLFRIPILYLVFSLVGLIQAARYYRDASGSTEYAANVGINARKMLELGNIISDFIGINLLIGSIPLIVCLIIDDPVIQTFTAVAVPMITAIYLSSEYTIEARRYRVWVRLPFALVFSLSLIIASLNTGNSLYYLSFIPLVLSVLITIHSMVFLQYRDI